MNAITIEIKAPEIVEALKSLADAFLRTPYVTQLDAIPATTKTVQPAAAPIQIVPVASPPEYTLEQLAFAATPIIDAGRRAEVVTLLQSFGVRALTHLPKEQYGAFASGLRGLGAKL